MSRMVSLGDVLVPRREVVHPRDNPSGEALFVGLEHIESNTGRRIGGLCVRLEDLTGRKPRFHAGDIVYGYLRPYLNKVWVADRPGLCSVDQYVFEVGGAADPQFVAAFLRSPLFLSRAPIDETPGQLPRIRLEEVLGVSIDLPPLDRQRRVAAVLIKELRFVDHARTWVLVRSEATKVTSSLLFSRTIAAVASSAVCRLGDVAQVIRGVTFNGAEASATPSSGKLPILRAGNIQEHLLTDRDLVWVPEGRISQDQRLRKGDIVIAMSSGSAAVVGKTAILDHAFGGSVGAFCALIRPSELVDPAYLAEWLRSRDFLEWRDGQSRGASIQNLRVSELVRLELPIPSKANQRLISERLQARRAATNRAAGSINAQVAALDTLRGALVRGAFEAADPG